MRDLIEQQTLLTNFESLYDCTLRQLQTLKVGPERRRGGLSEGCEFGLK